MKIYNLKPDHQIEALKRVMFQLSELERDAELDDASAAELWAYQETRAMIKRHIAAMTEINAGVKKAVDEFGSALREMGER